MLQCSLADAAGIRAHHRAAAVEWKVQATKRSSEDPDPVSGRHTRNRHIILAPEGRLPANRGALARLPPFPSHNLLGRTGEELLLRRGLCAPLAARCGWHAAGPAPPRHVRHVDKTSLALPLAAWPTARPASQLAVSPILARCVPALSIFRIGLAFFRARGASRASALGEMAGFPGRLLSPTAPSPVAVPAWRTVLFAPFPALLSVPCSR